jgi:hypothetical protein
MLQRNISGGTLILPTLNPPAEVFDGDTIDAPDLIAGFVPVDDDQPAAILAVDDLVDLGPAPDVAEIPPPTFGGTLNFTS